MSGWKYAPMIRPKGAIGIETDSRSVVRNFFSFSFRHYKMLFKINRKSKGEIQKREKIKESSVTMAFIYSLEKIKKIRNLLPLGSNGKTIERLQQHSPFSFFFETLKR
jgi:hypothetical protein